MRRGREEGEEIEEEDEEENTGRDSLDLILPLSSMYMLYM